MGFYPKSSRVLGKLHIDVYGGVQGAAGQPLAAKISKMV